MKRIMLRFLCICDIIDLIKGGNSMKNEYEIVPHERVKNINIIINKITYRNFHMHNDLEIIYVLDGSGAVNTRNKSFNIKQGSIILLNSYQEHEIDAHKETITAVFIQISNSLFRRFLNYFSNVFFKCNDITASISNEKAAELKSYILSAAITYFEEKEFFLFDFLSDISKILGILFTQMPIEIVNEKDYINLKKQANRMSTVITYIDENYLMPVHLEDICTLIQVTPTYLSHLFSENIGISFQEYLNGIRFEHAMRAVADKSLSLTKIAEISGFSKLKYMNQVFEKKLGMTPKEYRAAIADDINVQNSKNLLEYIFDEKESLEILYMLKNTDENS